ncbi:MAG: hypothetical protein ACO2ZN_13310, partial [Paracoccaceae bacterium]
MDWAMTQENIAIAYVVRAAFFDEEQDQAKAKADLEQALFHVDAALGVFDPVHSPYDHEKATALRERILSALQELNARRGQFQRKRVDFTQKVLPQCRMHRAMARDAALAFKI